MCVYIGGFGSYCWRCVCTRVGVLKQSALCSCWWYFYKGGGAWWTITAAVVVWVVCLFLFLLAHEPAALEEHIMELKHLTDCESYRGLKLLPCATSRCVLDTLVSHPDRDYFPVKYYPVRVYTYVFIYSFHLLSRPGLHTTRPGLFPYHLLSRPGL